MAKKTGTFGVSDLLQATLTPAVSPNSEYDLEDIAKAIAEDNQNFSQTVQEALSDFALTSTARQLTVASSIGGDMMEVDEFGRGPTQKDLPAYLVGFPLRKFQFPVGWTKQWEKNAKPADYAIKNQAAQGADLRRTRYELQKAIYSPLNYTFVDHLTDKAQISVKAFINADSTPIQNGPNGETFDGTTHSHYNGSATLTAVAVRALIQDIVEHRNGATVRLYINHADAASWTGLEGFVKLSVPGIALGNDTIRIEDPRLDITKLDNRLIGTFDGCEVWTKPWAVANYTVGADVAAPNKPLVRRVEENDRGLYVAAEIDAHPLRAEYVEHFYGFGAHNRVAIAVLKQNNETYSAPALSY